MKKIWMIEQVSRVKGTERWSEPKPIYAYTNIISARLDTNYKRGIEEDGYLEYNHIITEYELYDK